MKITRCSVIESNQIILFDGTSPRPVLTLARTYPDRVAIYPSIKTAKCYAYIAANSSVGFSP